MRAIDGDAIAPKLEGKFNQDMVRYAPTLDYKDLVPQGRWVTNEINGAPKELRDAYCSECKVNSGFNYSAAIEELNFCHNCGARMINN